MSGESGSFSSLQHWSAVRKMSQTAPKRQLGADLDWSWPFNLDVAKAETRMSDGVTANRRRSSVAEGADALVERHRRPPRTPGSRPTTVDVMGLVKRQLEEDYDRGWSSGGDKHVCNHHVEDDALTRLVAETVESKACAYCDRTGNEPFAAPLDELIQRIAEGLNEEWGNADDEGVAWEGGYVGTTYDTWDLLYDLVDQPFNNDDVMRDVIAALPEHAWVQTDFYRLRPHLRLQYGWEGFSDIVKHRRRYFFSDAATTPTTKTRTSLRLAPCSRRSATRSATLASSENSLPTRFCGESVRTR